MKPPVHYYGGKARLAPWIASLMPPHRVYLEPFFGSGAVLFAKPWARFEIVNDVDGNVVNFFEVLRTRRQELEVACFLTPHSRDEHAACRLDEHADDLDPVERARRWWVRCTQGFSKLPARSGWPLSTVMGASGGPKTMRSLIGRFADAAERLATVSIENMDAVDLIEKLGQPDGVIYCDPPYLGTTRAGLAKRPKDYACDFSDEEDHRPARGGAAGDPGGGAAVGLSLAALRRAVRRLVCPRARGGPERGQPARQERCPGPCGRGDLVEPAGGLPGRAFR